MTRQHHYQVNITPAPEGNTITHLCGSISDAISIVEEYAPDVFCTPITCWRADQEHTGYAGFYLEDHEQHTTIMDGECPCETSTGGTLEWGYPAYPPGLPGGPPDPYYYTTRPLPPTLQNLLWFTEYTNQWNEDYSILVEETP